MSALDLLSRAEVSSDLQHHTKFCDVDVLGAAGMAACQNPPHMSIFRVKYLADASEIDAAKALFIRWARKFMIARKINPSGASRVGVQALMAWLDDVCHTCHGRKYDVIEGTPALSGIICPDCNGSGKTLIRHEHVEVFKDLHDLADRKVHAILSGLDGKLGRWE